MVRLETGSVKLSYYVLESSLKWINKIVRMEDDRLPKICFSRLLTLEDDNKYNWISGIRMLLNKAQIGDINLKDSNSLCRILREDIAEFRLQLLREDMESLEASQFSLIYPALYAASDDHRPQEYLLWNISYNFKRFLAQLRTIGKYMIKFTFNRSIYKIDQLAICTVCNLLKRETIFHILEECPLYSPLRIHYLGGFGALGNVESLTGALVSLGEKKLKNLFFYMSEALKLRAFAMNE